MKTINQNIWIWSLLSLLFLVSCREDPIELTFYGRIEGEVTNEAFEPLANVVVSTNPATAILNTGEEGNFVFDSIPVGSYVVRARLEEFEEELTTIEVFDGQTTNLKMVMSASLDDNQAPGLPGDPIPANGAIDMPLDVELAWTCQDEDAGDTLSYDLIFFEAGSTPGTVIATELQDTTFQLEGLDFNTTYYWQIMATDGKHTPVYSEVWQFKTIAFPENRIHFTRKVEDKYLIFSANTEGEALAITTIQNSSWRPRMDVIRKNVAYLSFDGLEPHLFIMKPDGSEPIKVTSNVPVSSHDNFDLNYCWSPDGAQLLFMNFGQLYRINKDGSGFQLIAQAPINEVYTAVDWTSQGDKIVVLTTSSHPYETKLYLSTNDGAFQLILSQLNGTISSPSFSIDGKKILFSHDVSGFQADDGRQLDARIFLYEIETETLTDISFEKAAGTNDLEPRFSPTDAHVIFTNTPNDGVSRKDIWIMEVDGENRAIFQENAEMADWN